MEETEGEGGIAGGTCQSWLQLGSASEREVASKRFRLAVVLILQR